MKLNFLTGIKFSEVKNWKYFNLFPLIAFPNISAENNFYFLNHFFIISAYLVLLFFFLAGIVPFARSWKRSAYPFPSTNNYFLENFYLFGSKFYDFLFPYYVWLNNNFFLSNTFSTYVKFGSITTTRWVSFFFFFEYFFFFLFFFFFFFYPQSLFFLLEGIDH